MIGRVTRRSKATTYKEIPMADEKPKSLKLQAAETAWYAAEAKLQEAARRAAAEFLHSEGRTNASTAPDYRRGWDGRALHTAAEEYAKANDALRAVLLEES